MFTQSQTQIKAQPFISIEREIIKRINDFSERCLRDFDSLTLPVYDSKIRNYFIKHCIDHLSNAEDELKRVYELCSDFLSDPNGFTPDEVSFLTESVQTELSKIEKINNELTDKIDCRPFILLKESIRPDQVFIDANEQEERRDREISF